MEFVIDLDRHDNSGIRFYFGDQLRKHDLGFFTLGSGSIASGIAIPPRVDRFNVDSYCPPEATRVRIPR